MGASEVLYKTLEFRFSGIIPLIHFLQNTPPHLVSMIPSVMRHWPSLMAIRHTDKYTGRQFEGKSVDEVEASLICRSEELTRWFWGKQPMTEHTI